MAKLKLSRCFQGASTITTFKVISLVTLTFVLIVHFFTRFYKKEHFEDATVTAATTTVTAPQPSYSFTPVTKDDFTAQVNLSDFFASLSQEDLKARSKEDGSNPLQAGEHYKNEYIQSYEDLTEADKTQLQQIIESANKLIAKYPNLQQLEWRIAKISSTIEYGLPHTVGNMIVINKDTLSRPEQELIKTMIHEKIHIFQRMNTAATSKWTEATGFTALRPNDLTSISKDLLLLRRSNPDLDKNIYLHNKSNLVMRQLYNSKEPTSITDSKALGLPKNGQYSPVSLTNDLVGLPKNFYCQLEHPYEIMACLIAEMITRPSFAEENKGNTFISKTSEWMQSTL